MPNIPHCCLPKESGPCLSSNVADHSLKSATHRRLGGLLSHQLANGTRAHLLPLSALTPPRCLGVVLSGISSRFRLLSLCKRQVAHVLLTRSPLNKTESIATASLVPFDLHVLGMPPAFVLSQDQTLKFNLGFPRPSRIALKTHNKL